MADFTDLFIEMRRIHGEELTPGDLAVRRADAEMAQVAADKKKQEAESAWTALSAQNVSPGYNYVNAYSEGSTFKPGPDGIVTLPNKHAAKQEHNLAGYDLATGRRYRNVLQADDDNIGNAVLALRNSHVDQNGVAPMSDVRPLAQLAVTFRNNGKGYEEFDKNVPVQWNQDQRRLAWSAAVDVTNKGVLRQGLDTLQKTAAAIAAPAKFTQEETIADPQFATDARKIHKLFWGSEFEGGDIEAARWLRDHLRWFDINVAHQAAVMARVRAADYDGIQAYARAIDRWDNTAADLGAVNILQQLGRGIVDPTNLLGLGVGKAAVRTVGREALKTVLKRSVEIGAVAGGIGGGSTAVAKGVATGKPAGPGEVASGAAVGAAAGAGIGATLTAAGRAGSDLLRSGYRKMRNAAPRSGIIEQPAPITEAVSGTMAAQEGATP